MFFVQSCKACFFSFLLMDIILRFIFFLGDFLAFLLSGRSSLYLSFPAGLTLLLVLIFLGDFLNFLFSSRSSLSLSSSEGLRLLLFFLLPSTSSLSSFSVSLLGLFFFSSAINFASANSSSPTIVCHVLDGSSKPSIFSTFSP